MTTFHKFEIITSYTDVEREISRKFDPVSAIGRVYDLHKAVEGPHDSLICYHCSSFSTRHFVNYPCFTIVAIEDQELGE